MLIFDSYAWIEYFLGSEEGKEAKGYLEGRENVVTPGIVLAEIAGKYLREGVSEDTIDDRLRFVAAWSEVEPMGANLSLMAAKAWRELSNRAKSREIGGVSLTDGIILATARKRDGKVVTGDPHFESLEEAIMLGKPS